eukprot:TRINITY_DN5075_c0_g1_i1.p1 TRINITY_DN5075_c0_g1~~TRINITY_DN5075_c0_g1_i1.p1  ORF type:complete len:748 (+),score=277.44 TRINITY_DN5075_c0_g1_i1:80-2323(+)
MEVEFLRQLLDEEFQEGHEVVEHLEHILQVLNTEDLLFKVFRIDDENSNKISKRFLKRIFTVAKINHWKKSWLGLCLMGFASDKMTQKQVNLIQEEWFKWILESLKNRPQWINAGLISLVAAKFVRAASKYPDSKRTVLSTHVPKLVQLITKTIGMDGKETTVTQSESLEAIRMLIAVNPNSVKPYAQRIEEVLFNRLFLHQREPDEETDEEVMITLSQLSVCEEDSWNRSTTQLFNILDWILNKAYSGIEEKKDLNDNTDDKFIKQLIGIESPTENKAKQIKSQFSIAMKCLSMFLSGNLNAFCYSVPLNRFGSLIMKVLKVERDDVELSHDKKESTLDPIDRYTIIPHFHRITYQFVSCLVTSLNRSILPYVLPLCQTIVGGLDENRNSPSLRGQVYKTIKSFVIGLGASLIETIGLPAIPFILNDIKEYFSQRRDNITITLQSVNKKQKKNAEESFGMKKVDQTAELDESTCVINGLDALESILLYGGSLIPLSIRTEIDTVTTSCFFEQCIDKSSTKLPLLRCLLNSLLSPTPNQPSCLPYALIIFRRGRTDTNLEISNFCVQAMAVCELIIHPRAPPLPLHRSSVLSEVNQQQQQPLAVFQPQLFGQNKKKQEKDSMDIVKSKESKKQEEEKKQQNKRKAEEIFQKVAEKVEEEKKEVEVEESESEEEEPVVVEQVSKKTKIQLPQIPQKREVKKVQKEEESEESEEEESEEESNVHRSSKEEESEEEEISLVDEGPDSDDE